MEALENETILASAIAYLISGEEREAAAILLASSSLIAYEDGDSWYVGNEIHSGIHITISSPRQAHEIIIDDKNPLRKAIYKAFQAILPEKTYISQLTA